MTDDPQKASASKAPEGIDREAWRDRVRRKIALSGMTAKELAKANNISASMVYDLLRGREPGITNFARVAEALGLSLDEAYYGARPQTMQALGHVEVTIEVTGNKWNYADSPRRYELIAPFSDNLVVAEMKIEPGSFGSGDLIFCQRYEGDVAAQLYPGQLAVVETQGALHRYFGHIHHSPRKGEIQITPPAGYRPQVIDCLPAWIGVVVATYCRPMPRTRVLL
ncbi:MAG: helix-turn-helix domain-containing protein [Hyphomicrobiaceae bacterium]